MVHPQAATKPPNLKVLRLGLVVFIAIFLAANLAAVKMGGKRIGAI